MKYLSAVAIGAIFGIGIVLAGMADPAKVMNFFDIAGTWDPSLAFVMAGALLVTAPGYVLIQRRRQRPVFDTMFHIPAKGRIDARLIGGSVLFGIGWGIAGFCPGGSIPALGLGHHEAYIFLAALVTGMLTARWFLKANVFGLAVRAT
ncbi:MULTISPECIES: YeeE/YedE family protein [Alphaproteobacteria]|uniref:Membrane protein n=2 Tax=Alphaproteobacteria TaxID=28211 RepID=A0A512HI96_9HYPH|nr:MULTISPECIES: YeeE/YedE family protein [Alphaproteobacteria]GEO85110.1 membrane protein [Ciceribacter naphthalenivorans]GLR24556.1 membrane protein [Ciceribacter naphthalenivorans]GLT07412.1 membrane protein [Sphingomonas psychrolutea]